MIIIFKQRDGSYLRVWTYPLLTKYLALMGPNVGPTSSHIYSINYWPSLLPNSLIPRDELYCYVYC